jgi:hypothetical protein
MAEIRTGHAGEPSAWSTRDLMVIAAIGVALGVVLVPVIYATMALLAALGPLGWRRSGAYTWFRCSWRPVSCDVPGPRC